MLGSPVLDVATGLIFVFLLIGLVCSQVGDTISRWLRWRAKELEGGIRNFIVGPQNDNLFRDLYNNPLIHSLVPEDVFGTRVLEKTPLKALVHSSKALVPPGKTPLHIPADAFTLALFDMLVPSSTGQTRLDQLRASVAALPTNTPMRTPLLSLINTADGKIDTLRTNVENWFENTMTRTSMVYQRNMWSFAFFIAAVISVFLNVDSISIATHLWNDSSLRAAIVAEASKYAQGTPEQAQALQQLNALSLPIGWQIAVRPSFYLCPTDWSGGPDLCTPPPGLRTSPLKVLGWAITALAGAQGAPFWFDLLKKLTERD